MKISGEMEEVPVGEMGLGYRTSIFSKNGDIVMSADIKLDTGDVEKIRANMEELKKKRVEKQPLEYPSAGSTFKRPEGYFAGKLIQDSGLRGFRVGDAQVSEKHCGFVVNRGQATAAEIMDLIEQVSDRVYTQFGVRLEPEVRQVGEF
jgi:UDP-N-acetylmuramate dehydrogenase